MSIRMLLASSLALAAAALAEAADFTEGDVYIMTSAWPGIGGAVARIDPVTGDKTVIDAFGTYPASSRMTYDPYRDRLLYQPDINLNIYRFLAADGSYDDITINWDPDIVTYAPTGDGRIYLLAGVGTMAWLDTNDQPTILYDTDGTTPFVIPIFMARRQMIYDAGTNSLFIAHYGFPDSQVTKIPLSADGTRVDGPLTTVEYDGIETYEDEPQGISAGPNGSIFIKIRGPSNEANVLMFTIDPTTLAFSHFATIQHNFSAWNRAGTYNSTYDLAYAVDEWNDRIRTYVQAGGVQAGATLTTGVSGAGAQCYLVSIGDTINGAAPPPACPADLNGDADVNVLDLLDMLTAWGPNPGHAADLNNDGVVNVLDLIQMLATWGPC